MSLAFSGFPVAGTEHSDKLRETPMYPEVCLARYFSQILI